MQPSKKNKFFNIIGPGKLGKNIAYALIQFTDFRPLNIYSRSYANASAAVSILGHGKAVKSLDDLEPASITLITVPDEQISLIAGALAIKNDGLTGSTVMHMSGVLNSDILAPLQQIGCYTASFHPLKAFLNDKIEPHPFEGCLTTYEGDQQAITVASPLFKTLGCELIPLHTHEKASYHAAAAMASNYLITLASESINLLKNVGIDELLAKTMVSNLMQSSLNNLLSAASPALALTGPLQRGDVATIHAHLAAIKEPHQKRFYCAAGLATLSLTHLSEETLNKLNLLLQNP